MFLIPRTDVIVILLAECGLVLCGPSLCCVTFRHREAGKKKLYGTAALGRNYVYAMCGIPIFLHKSSQINYRKLNNSHLTLNPDWLYF